MKNLRVINIYDLLETIDDLIRRTHVSTIGDREKQLEQTVETLKEFLEDAREYYGDIANVDEPIFVHVNELVKAANKLDPKTPYTPKVGGLIFGG